jgi:A/G-specific adenine glycosylase
MLNTNVETNAIQILHTELLIWFGAFKRDLPFRNTKNPYIIWISEIMAQQTQIDTLIPYFNRFISFFPDILTLANATEDQVIKSWEGLGYYSRARNLHKSAKIIANEYHGIFPKTFSELIKLPGIGPYTGGAIASIAYNEKVSAVDGNVLRVISRYCNSFLDISAGKTKKKITEWLETILPDTVGDFNEALMELGAITCTPKNPSCLICPISMGCQSYRFKTMDQLPIKRKKQKQTKMQMEVGIVYHSNTILFVKRPNSGLLSGFWSFPIIETNLGDGLDIKAKLSEIFPTLSNPIIIGESRHVFSHIIWELTVYQFILPLTINETPTKFITYPIDTPSIMTQFKSLESINDLALPIAFSKLIPLISNASDSIPQ